MIALHRMARLLGLIPSRHPQGSLTGWSCLARVRPAAPTVYFTRRRSTPLALCPVVEGDLVPFSTPTAHRRPYDAPKDAA